MKKLMGFIFTALSLFAGDKKDDKWDVNKPEDQLKTITLDTTTGTWMSLDISPDGKQIVFDMLGDIFIIPAIGGEATALSSGLSWDMQPTFSPDGKSIAFTSDRGGGDNIWIMKLDGSDAKAISKEKFRLLNSPSWSPDGQYIVGRKHFSSTRSLGSGEMWLYHISGTSGLQMTKKPNKQKDVGEPAFSPNGKYLYYSQDTTPGNTFDYSKDPNPGIYSIKRLDRKTGKTTTIIKGSGGAIRPTPSNNGKWLAFIRRVRYQTSLFVKDLASGAEYKLTDTLDRDMQETWAIHGVYPTMTWSPDDKSIYFWAEGKIQQINVQNKEIKNIPFHVKIDHTMVPHVRFPIDVAPKNFNVKLMRWTNVSPNGRQGRLSITWIYLYQ